MYAEACTRRSTTNYEEVCMPEIELQYPAPEAPHHGPAPLGSNYQDDHYAHYPDCDVASCRARGHGLFDTIYECRGLCNKHFCGFHVPIHMPTGICDPCYNEL